MGSGFGRWLWRERQRAKSCPHPHPAARGRLSPPPLGPAGEPRAPWARRNRLRTSRGTEGVLAAEHSRLLRLRQRRGGPGGIACPLPELCRRGPPSGWGGRPRAQLSLGEVRGWGKGPPAWGAGPATPARPLSCSGLLNCPFMRAPLLPPAAASPPPPSAAAALPRHLFLLRCPACPRFGGPPRRKALLATLGPLACLSPCLLHHLGRCWATSWTPSLGCGERPAVRASVPAGGRAELGMGVPVRGELF